MQDVSFKRCQNLPVSDRCDTFAAAVVCFRRTRNPRLCKTVAFHCLCSRAWKRPMKTFTTKELLHWLWTARTAINKL